jgi:hypothetical protein
MAAMSSLGNISQSTGTVSLSANGASSFTTSSGGLTLTSAAAATWSTASGNLTIQAGGGTLSLGTTTSLAASGALTISSGGSGDLALDSASNLLQISANDTTIQRIASGTYTFDLKDGSNTTLSLTNSGAGLAGLDVEGGINIGTGQTYKVNGSQISSANLSNDTNLAKLNGTGPQIFTGDNKFTATLLSQNATNSTTAFQVQNANGSNALSVDTTPLNSILSNSSFENTNVSAWVYLGTPGSVARDTSQQYYGNASLKVITTANANNGVKYVTGASGLATSTTYIISWYDKLDSSSGSITDIKAVYARDGSTESACTSINNQTVIATAWTYHYCTITTDGTTPASTAYLAISRPGSTARTFYIDGVQIETNSSNIATAYKETGLNLQGAITSNTAFSGLLTIQPASALLAGQNNVSQIFTNASSTGGTVQGYSQTITVANTSTLTNTIGQNITLTDNASALANHNTGISITLNGSNNTMGQTGIDVSVNKGSGIRAITSGASSDGAPSRCNSVSGLSVGVCAGDSGSSNTGAGVYAYTASRATTNNYDPQGSGVYGLNNGIGTSGSFYAGVRGITLQSAVNQTSTSYGVFGQAKGGTTATAYGGYFTLDSTSLAPNGAALYASNSSIANNIFQLQDNTSDVLVVGDGGSVSVTPSDATKTITLGSTSQTGTITLGQSTATNIINIGTAAGASNTQTINIGTSSTASSTTNVTIGSNIAGTTTVNGASGVNIGTGSAAPTVQVGNTANGVSQTLNIGNNATPSSSTTLNLGSAIGASPTTIQGGSSGVVVKPANSTAAFQVQNSSGAAILVVDSSNRQLKIFENSGTTNYALIYFDTATTSANFTANTGTVAVGRGAGAISIASGGSSAITITAAAASTWSTTAGTLTLQSGSGSSDYLILNANGSGQVQVNGSAVVKLGSTSADPTCTNGAIYYNTTTPQFRGCVNGTWQNLASITPTLQTTYTNSTGSTTPEIKLDSTRGGVDIQDADSSIGGVLFAVRGSNAGGLGTSLFNVSNSSNNIVQIGSSTGHSTGPVVLGLDNYANSGADPTGFNGAMYYNGTNNKFRCYENAVWVDCINGPADSATTFDGNWAATSAKAATNTILLVPIYLTGQTTVNEIRINVTTTLGAAGDVGLYNSAGTLVLNGGSSSLTTTTGVKTITPTQAAGAARTLEAGQYYAAVTWNSTTGVVGGTTVTSGQIKKLGTLATGGLVLPSSITPSSITTGTILPGITFNN